MRPLNDESPDRGNAFAIPRPPVPGRRSRRGISWLALSILGAAATTVAAQAASVILTAEWIHPVSAPTIHHGSIRIQDGKITEVGAKVSGDDATRLDLGTQHLYPGLIAASTVLGLVEIDSIRASRDSNEVGDYTPDVYSWLAVNPDSELIPVARANGFTHVEVTPQGGVVSGYSGLIRLAGWTIEDLSVKKAVALNIFWPSFALDLSFKTGASSSDKTKSPEDQIKDRERQLKELDEFFNEAEAYHKAASARKDDPTFARVPAWDAMLPAVRHEVPLFIHANELRQIRSAAEWLARRHYTGVIVGAQDAWRCAELLATNHIGVVFEQVFSLPGRDVDSYDVHFSAPAVLNKSGVKVAFGEGAERFGASNVRNLPYSAAQAAAFGLPREEAVKGLTLYPAEMLGVADHLGSLAPGRDATVIAVDGDILDIKSHVTRMWIEGQESDLSSRHTRLNSKYQKRPKPTP